MRINILISMLLLVLAAACGESENGGAAPPAANLDRTPIDPESLTVADWEFFPVAKNRHSYVWGRVVDVAGAPVAGATATELHPCLTMNVAPNRGRSVSTDEEGIFRIDDFAANAMVIVEKEGRGGRLVNTQDLLPSLEEPRDFALRPSGTVRGLVRLPGERPVAGNTILMFSSTQDWFSTTETDAAGAYRVADVPEGEVHILAAPGRVRGEPATGTVSAGEELRVDLTVDEIPAVTGRILDKATGKPLKTALVVTMMQREEVYPVDEDGSFRIEGAPGMIMFAIADGYGEFGVSLDPARTEAQHVELLMEPGAQVYGRVVDERGEPLGGIRVEALIAPEQGGPRLRGPLTGPDGRFAFTWISIPPEGASVILLAKSAGDHFGYKRIGHLDRGVVQKDVELEFTRPASVRLRIVDGDGEPRRHAWVQMGKDVEGLPGSLIQTLRPENGGVTDGEGVVRVTGLYGGTHKLIVIPPGRIPMESVIDIEPGVDNALPDLVVPRGLSITGRIVSIGGNIHDVHDYFVTASDVHWQASLEIDEDGNFTLEGLEDGEYILSAQLKDHNPVTMKVRGGQKDIKVRMTAVCFLTVKVNHPEVGRISAKIELVRMGPTHQLGKPWERRMPSTEDEVEFFGLPAGRCLVRLSSNSWVARKEILLAPGDRTAVELSPGPAASITGTVVGPDGRPAIDLGVECDAGKSWGVEGVKTEDQGRFQFAGLPEGPVTIRCHPYGHPPAVAELNLVAGEVAEVSLQLAPGARIEISVVDEDEQPLPEVKVVLTRMDEYDARFWIEGGESTRTGPDGRLVFVGVQPGSHMMRVYLAGEDEPRERRTIDLVDGGTEKLRFQFDK